MHATNLKFQWAGYIQWTFTSQVIIHSFLLSAVQGSWSRRCATMLFLYGTSMSEYPSILSVDRFWKACFMSYFHGKIVGRIQQWIGRNCELVTASFIYPNNIIYARSCNLKYTLSSARVYQKANVTFTYGHIQTCTYYVYIKDSDPYIPAKMWYAFV